MQYLTRLVDEILMPYIYYHIKQLHKKVIHIDMFYNMKIIGLAFYPLVNLRRIDHSER